MTLDECVRSGQHGLFLKSGVYHEHAPPGPEAHSLSIERISQPTDDTCWFAVFSMLTGVPLDALPWDSEPPLVPEVYADRQKGRPVWSFDPASAWYGADPDDCTLADWNMTLIDAGLEIVEYQDDIPQDRPVGIVLWNPVTGWTHVVVQHEGRFYDPSPKMFMVHDSEYIYTAQGAQPVLAFSIEKVTKPVTKA